MENKGFFGSLFDLSFTDFVTIRIIKIIFVIAIILSGIASVGVLVTGLAGGAWSGILALITAPIVFILTVLWARIWLEIIIVLFRIAENTGKLVEAGRDNSQASSDES